MGGGRLGVRRGGVGYILAIVVLLFMINRSLGVLIN